MKEEIKDTEIRVVGVYTDKRPRFRWYYILALSLIVLLLVMGGILAVLDRKTIESNNEDGVFEKAAQFQQPHPLRGWIEGLDSIHVQGTVIKDLVVNDIPLRIYAPINCSPRLEIGYEVIKNRAENILLFQAADIRADNKKIVGAFVLRGQPLSWGLSKRGFCSIIDGQVTVGVADNSPLFEEATDRGGYFFRQYPLVDNGVLVENELKTKSLRRSLCDLEGRIVVVETQSTESLHDFAQALVDIGATNAIYLVGSNAIGWSRDIDGNGTKMGLWDIKAYKNVNFIVWSR